MDDDQTVIAELMGLQKEVAKTTYVALTSTVPTITDSERQVVDSDEAIVMAIAHQVIKDTDEVERFTAIGADVATQFFVAIVVGKAGYSTAFHMQEVNVAITRAGRGKG